MRALIQRVYRASVFIEHKEMCSIKKGLLVFLGVGSKDINTTHERMVDKILNMRIFPEENSPKMNRSLLDVNGELLVVSQFTLYSNIKRGRRPSFIEAAKPEIALKIFNNFCSYAKTYNIEVKEGVFGSEMNIELTNWGPVTLYIDEEKDF